MPDFMTLGLLPPLHPRTIVLRTASVPGGGGLAAAFANDVPLVEAVGGGGLARLARLEKDGGVVAVDPVGGSSGAASAGAPRAWSALSAMAAQAGEDDPGAATIVTLTPGVDVDDLLADLVADAQVEYADRVPARYVAMPGPMADQPGMMATGVPPASDPWNLVRIGLPQVEAQGIDDARDIRVGVLDTGVDEGHPALRDLLAAYTHGGSGSTGTVSASDVVGHGTHVSGTVASAPSVRVGARGICRAGVKVWKIFDDQPDYFARAGVYWYLVDPVMYRSALADCIGKVDVLNLSIGGPQPPDRQESALYQQLLDSGVSVVAAMGNERSNGSPISYPAAIPGVIAVGATNTADTVAPFSNSGGHISLVAPGTGIWSTLPTYPGQIGYRADRSTGVLRPGVPFPRDTYYAAMDGTSMAAPHVTAAVALLLANSPHGRSPQEVRDLLMVTATRLPAMNEARWTPDYGTGLLNLRRLVFAARNL
ncbi:Serine protease, subtilisin family [Raineyella antarctica]|uniref:Serine protease, subtilisin family n=1 Tax=Raineyella antarctica TaxID=1577474 RepID=A0A1G6HCU9_9ACTN|nr:S8 family serine peptidase [Raineyella antarctica]SDB91755.1 Serine protease, subtilisin family [Raineyella antarctica]